MSDGGWTWARVEAERTPATASARVCVRGDLVSAIEAMEADLTAARVADEDSNEPDTAPSIAARIVELIDEAKAAEVEFTFRAIGRRPYSDLVAGHPPTDEQREQGNEWNPDTFPAALIAASCVAPEGVTLDAAQRLCDEWPLVEMLKLWRPCLTVNIGGVDVPKAVSAYALLRASAPSSTTADPGASPDHSS